MPKNISSHFFEIFKKYFIIELYYILILIFDKYKPCDKTFQMVFIVTKI